MRTTAKISNKYSWIPVERAISILVGAGNSARKLPKTSLKTGTTQTIMTSTSKKEVARVITG